MKINEVVAQRIKSIRADNGWSLTRAAALTGVSKAMLGQIERGESSPTLATLWKITQGFNLPLSQLLQTEVGQSEPREYYIEDQDIKFSTLFSFDHIVGTEMFALQVAPGKTHHSRAHKPGVIEDIIVINGILDIRLEGEWQSIESGSVLRFKADQAHSYRNCGPDLVIFHNVIHYSN